jgi:peptidoglycan/LPS O-acetylase OafA/YrhL
MIHNLKIEMFWQLRRDLISLFTRGNDHKSSLDPIDGLRSIANLSIIFLHLVTIFSSLVLPYPHIEWQEYLNSAAFALNNIMILTLEIFFMLSGFLLTYKLMIQWNKNFPNVEYFLFKEYPISIIKRALRFWPGMLLATLIMFVFGEPRYPNSGYFFEFFRYFNTWIFCQNYLDLEYWSVAFAPLWTISLDMQIHIILPLILYLFNVYKNCLSILLLISIIRGIIVFNPLTMPVLSIGYRYPVLRLLSPDHFNDWRETNYNLTFSSNYLEDNPAKLFMHKMYLPLEARFGSFIIGGMLAIKLLESSNDNNKSSKLKKFLFFGLICFHILTMIQRSNLSVPHDLVITLVVASSRQLFTIGQAFILFTALCSNSHPYHSPWIKKFLSLSIWIPISKLSYFVYLIHWRISFELIYGQSLRFLTKYSVTYASLICLPIILFISQFISCIWYVLVEKPIERAIQLYFHKNHVN